ncbi:Panacea domain-containing protein [Curtobacterium sp. SP.BCp]|uniref:Panacea domain-containing protein n=1 Tax=Curtobacterium sp. SP.BCp TaxID=3435230 RepID=UPI003F7384F7
MIADPARGTVRARAQTPRTLTTEVPMLHANDVASVILARSGTWMDAMRLQKLLYYVQSWHLAITDEPLFTERFKAYKNGPVVPQVWHDRKDRATRRPANQDLNGIELDDLSSAIVDEVLAMYGSLTGDELSALTHTERPWVEARAGLPEDAPSSEPLSEQSMARFYRAHRRLGGRTAADLAAGGVHPSVDLAHAEPVDIDAILASIPDADHTFDDWGGANLEPARPGAVGSSRRRDDPEN